MSALSLQDIRIPMYNHLPPLPPSSSIIPYLASVSSQNYKTLIRNLTIVSRISVAFLSLLSELKGHPLTIINHHLGCFFRGHRRKTMKYNEISHFSHPQHILKFEYTEIPFKCDGCKEVGIGSHYRCSFCDFDLHMHCAIPSLSISHPFYTKCSFQFLSRPPGDTPRYCNACEKDVTGFVYHCKSCGFDLHPCCAKLPMVLDDGEVKLYLYRKVSAPCHRCGRRGRSWSYRSACKKYNLHVACVREMLAENWHELYFGRGKGTRKLETRIPSLKNTLQTPHKRSKSKVKKGCEMAGLALQFVISAMLGDPTTLIAGVIGTLMSGG